VEDAGVSGCIVALGERRLTAADPGSILVSNDRLDAFSFASLREEELANRNTDFHPEGLGDGGGTGEP
jgi:hypothetical protein